MALRPNARTKNDVAAPRQPWRAPGRDGAQLAVQDFPTFFFERVASLARRKLARRYLEQFKLSLPEWRTLNLVALGAPTSFGEIARLSTMDKAQISLSLRSLAARGLIAIASNGAARGGARRGARAISLTPRGRSLMAKILPEARRMQMRFLERLLPDERRQLHALLAKSVTILDALDPDTDGPARQRPMR